MSERYTVTHQGVPVGTVDLAIGTHQGVGTLDTLPGYQAVAPTLGAAARLGRVARSALLVMPSDGSTPFPELAEVQRAAALTFELWDERGTYVPATMIRMVRLRTRPGITVFVDFGEAGAEVYARTPKRPGQDCDEAPVADP
ncbi:MAG TPA: hypothetical protein VFW89_06110 [Gemmatimonadaceae bacterium]|nr:hypothetical protein [Gemmatimonadaceae bacterium]